MHMSQCGTQQHAYTARITMQQLISDSSLDAMMLKRRYVTTSLVFMLHHGARLLEPSGVCHNTVFLRSSYLNPNVEGMPQRRYRGPAYYDRRCDSAPELPARACLAASSWYGHIYYAEPLERYVQMGGVHGSM